MWPKLYNWQSNHRTLQVILGIHHHTTTMIDTSLIVFIANIIRIMTGGRSFDGWRDFVTKTNNSLIMHQSADNWWTWSQHHPHDWCHMGTKSGHLRHHVNHLQATQNVPLTWHQCIKDPCCPAQSYYNHELLSTLMHPRPLLPAQ